MSKSQNYFLEDFDGKKEELIVEVERIFTKDDVAAARTSGYAEGYTSGLNEGYIQGEIESIRERDLQLQSALSAINEQLTNIFITNADFVKTLDQQSVELSMLLMQTVLPLVMEKYLKSEALETIQLLIKKIINLQTIDMTVNPDIHTMIKDKLTDYFGDAGRKITLHVKDDAEVSFCHIKWNGGYGYSNLRENFESLHKIIMETFQLDNLFQLELKL
jgi:flagellar biosynthesis/type III secretory pathway protein FliH